MAILSKKQFQPSGHNTDFHYSGKSYSEYIFMMRNIIEKTRLDLNKHNAEIIIDANSPYEWRPENVNAIDPETKKYKRGVLLIHGLFDSPCIFQNLSEHFIRKNYLVRALLLPGHGTIPGDLLSVEYSSWLKATKFAVDCFKADTENFIIAGFSTGALLGLIHALQDPFIKALVLLSPAVKLQKKLAFISSINHLMKRTIGGVKWYIQREEKDYAKYQSFTFNSVQQVNLLTKLLIDISNQVMLNTPVFSALTSDDEVIDINSCMNLFNKFPSSQNRIYLYTNDNIELPDDRMIVLPSHFPQQSIVNFSHMCLPISPKHPHYGMNGDFSDSYKPSIPFSPDFLRKLFQKASSKKNKFYGATTPANLQLPNFHRLTYNPDFDLMINRLDDFLDEIK